MSETATKPKIVIDTNTWVEAVLATLSPETATPAQQQSQRLTEYARQHFDVIFSEATMLELSRVVADPNGITNELARVNAERDALDLGPLRFLSRSAYINALQRELVKPHKPGKSPTRCEADKHDQMFLDVAFGTGTSLIVSSDHHLLDLKASWCRILIPTAFCNEIMREGAAPNLSSLRAAADVLIGINTAQQVADKRVARKTGQAEAPTVAVPLDETSVSHSFSEPHAKRRPKASFNDPKKQPDKAPEAPLKGALAEKLAPVARKLRKT